MSSIIKKRLWGALAALVISFGVGSPVLAQVSPRRSADFVTLYATNGISVSCSAPGVDPRLTLAVDHVVDSDGNLAPVTSVAAGRRIVITDMEYGVVTDAGRHIHLAVYGSVPGGSYTGHPRLMLPSRASDQGGGIGVAVQKGQWFPGIVIPAGQRPCIAEVSLAPISKDTSGTGVLGFSYVMLHGYLTSR